MMAPFFILFTQRHHSKGNKKTNVSSRATNKMETPTLTPTHTSCCNLQGSASLSPDNSSDGKAGEGQPGRPLLSWVERCAVMCCVLGFVCRYLYLCRIFINKQTCFAYASTKNWTNKQTHTCILHKTLQVEIVPWSVKKRLQIFLGRSLSTWADEIRRRSRCDAKRILSSQSPHTHSLTHSLDHSLTHPLTNSFTRSSTH